MECEGYTIRLCWENDPKSGRRFNSTRSFTLFKWDENEIMDEVQVDYYLEKIDMSSSFISTKRFNDKDEYAYGPFGVFSCFLAKELTGSRRVKQENNTVNNLGKEGIPLPGPFKADRQIHNAQIHERCYKGPFDDCLKNTSQFPLLDLSSSYGSDQSTYHFYWTAMENMNFSKLNTYHVESLLLQFWDSNLSALMVPIASRENNPFRTILNQGISILVADNTKSIILHTVCALTASFLAATTNEEERISKELVTSFEEYWKYHQEKAFHFISQVYPSLGGYDFRDVDTIVASIMLLLTIDIFHPNLSNWEIHMNGVLSIIKRLLKPLSSDLEYFKKQQRGVSGTTKFFFKMNTLSYIFAQTNENDISSTRISLLKMKDFEFIKEIRENDRESLLFHSYGVPDIMLSCLYEVVLYLQNHRENTGKSNGKSESDIEKMILEAKPKKMQETNAEFNSLNDLIRYHQLMIFYIALRIYFSREVLNLTLIELQDLVNEGIDHIELNAELSKHLNSMGLLWPCFIICCETTNLIGQLRLNSWLTYVGRFNIANIVVATDIIYSVWERRKDNLNLRWNIVKQEINPLLLLS
jgi:hypothetical protein